MSVIRMNVEYDADREECAGCGFDHELEPSESFQQHALDGFADHSTAEEFIKRLPNASVTLFVLDPPYFEIVAEEWDNQWTSKENYIHWMIGLLQSSIAKLKPNGSMLIFGGLGKHGSHPFWELCMAIEKQTSLTYRNTITWKKRRAYGKSHDYLFCREEIAWFSKSSERTEVVFNIPLLDVKRGYAGFNPKYPAKSEYKRVSNVWDDIPELMRPARTCEKPEPLYDRLIATHSNETDLVVDLFLGTGNSGVSSLRQRRRFLGCDTDGLATDVANKKFEAVARDAKNSPEGSIE